MRVKDAILLALTKGQLRKAAVRLAIDVSDVDSVNHLTEALSKNPKAGAAILLEYLPDARLEDVGRYVPIGPEPTRQALLVLAETDQDDDESLPVAESDALDSNEPADQETAHFPIGALVTWNGLIGVIDLIQARQLTVKFDDGTTMAFAAESAVLDRVVLAPGMTVTRPGDPTSGVVLEAVASAGYPTWRVQFPTSRASVAEMGLRPAVFKDPLARMKAGQLGNASDFNLRSVAADYWTEHLHNELVSLAHARVDLKPHQVSVVHRVISKYPHRFLLCDEVGLGKTIEAAMVIKELRARKQAARVLILVPSGLVRQWQFELKTKFNESFAIYNSDTIRYLVGKGVANPWGDSDSIIASHTWAAAGLLRQRLPKAVTRAVKGASERLADTPDGLSGLEELTSALESSKQLLSERARAITEVSWDMIVVDEAHHARVHKDGTRTQLVRLVQALIARPEASRRAALMLTATPLQLDRAELYSLVEMLDPVLFASPADFDSHLSSLAGLNQTVERLLVKAPLQEDEMGAVVRDVARLLKLEEDEAEELIRTRGQLPVADLLRDRHRLSEVMIRNRRSVVHGFQPRSAYRWEVDLSPEELRVHELMQEVLEQGFRLAETTKQNAIGFLMVILQKLLASSPQALLTSLRKRRTKLEDVKARAIDEEAADDLFDSDQEAAGVVASLAPSTQIAAFDEVIALLENLTVDTKADVLVEKLTALASQEPSAKVLIFTEFRETQDMLADRLGGQWSVHKFHGQLSPEQKDSSVEAFRSGKGAQILVSTEAGGEGRNFQFCHHLVNYDLPWNPMRVEQRIGRIDRIGQEHPITIFNFHVQGTIEGRILDVLEKRIRVFEEAVGGLDPILGRTEGNIKEAIRLAQVDRDHALERLGQSLEREIRDARDAGRKLEDFIMQDKSYAAEIAQIAMQAKAPISQADFEGFLTRLLISVGTYIYPRQPNGERRIVFHVPFVIDYPELIRDGESRRVCFDPRLNVDSEQVEYLGFGHPVVDRLVTRVTEEKSEGMAAVRSVPTTTAPSGWQFNWMLTVGGLKPKRFVLPTFISDEGEADEEIGRRLLLLSRQFQNETTDSKPDTETLDTAHGLAEAQVIVRRDGELTQARSLATERADIEEERLRALHRHRTAAAHDRIASCEATLERLRISDDAQVRQAIPLWEANLARAQGELHVVDDDLQRSLVELAARRNPTAEYELLNVARVEAAR
jgi:ATP-dependent helicase HepA